MSFFIFNNLDYRGLIFDLSPILMIIVILFIPHPWLVHLKLDPIGKLFRELKNVLGVESIS